jgi:hypothetical protein
VQFTGSEKRVAEAVSDDNQLVELRLTPVGEQRRDKICINVAFRNLTNKPVGWDQEFSVFMGWHVTPIDNEADLAANIATGMVMHSMDPTTVEEEVRQTKESLSEKRFAMVPPQESLNKTVCLTEPFRCFNVKSWEGTVDSRHPSRHKGYESLQRYRFDNRTKWVTVVLGYKRSRYSNHGFSALFGFHPDKVSLSHGNIGQISSNPLVLQVK